MPTLPAVMVTLLLPFERLFDPRTWRKAQLLAMGAILSPGKRTVSSALNILGIGQHGDFAIYHHVLNRARWSPLQLSRVLSLLVAGRLGSSTEPLVFGIDETVERRWGRKLRPRGGIKMCKNAEMELTQPKVVASSADTRRRCRRHIAKGGSSERDIRDERRWPFDPGDRQGAGGIAEHGAPVSAIAGGHAAEGAATKRVEAGSVHRVHRRADGGGVGKLHGAAPGVNRLGL